ncbi:MAG: class II aldolase/adducin family protein [Campylobacterales bacterium]|nr:class II aldolase/adducin family protein [Campylobacterales bacterium]
MKSLFDDTQASNYENDPLAMRVYTSQLLGKNQDLVLHGGGNTSVKIDGILYVKGSGWNLDTIEKEGFSPVDLNTLIEMAKRDTLSDMQMVKEQRDAMSDQSFPNPSIEAILHAILPFTYVDHTHADAVVTLTNTPNGKELMKELYGKNMLLIDYVMPGFELAKHIHTVTQEIDWETLEGIILLNHGVFTFDNDAKVAYEKMIAIVTIAENYLEKNVVLPSLESPKENNTDSIKKLCDEVATLRNCPIFPILIDSQRAKQLSLFPNLKRVMKQGELTPEHVIRIKPFPALIDTDIEAGILEFQDDYQRYFNKYRNETHICLDLAPRYAILKGLGAVALGKDEKEARIIADIVEHTITAILSSEQLGAWTSLSLAQMFAMEYWELEQAKLKKK